MHDACYIKLGVLMVRLMILLNVHYSNVKAQDY
jgi:hypothetical protein